MKELRTAAEVLERLSHNQDALRAAVEVSALPRILPRLLNTAPKGDRRPVLTLPGYGGADGSMWLTREFLRRLNYRCYALELGRNLDSGDARIQSVDDALRFRAARYRWILRITRGGAVAPGSLKKRHPCR